MGSSEDGHHPINGSPLGLVKQEIKTGLLGLAYEKTRPNEPEVSGNDAGFGFRFMFFDSNKWTRHSW